MDQQIAKIAVFHVFFTKWVIEINRATSNSKRIKTVIEIRQLNKRDTLQKDGSLIYNQLTSRIFGTFDLQNS